MKAFAKWIKPVRNFGDICPVYIKRFSVEPVGEKAILTVTSLGCYEIILNGRRVSDYVLAPGWTEAFPSSGKRGRLQFQEYDVSHLIEKENVLKITVGRGWYRSPLAGWLKGERDPRLDLPPCVTARLCVGDTAIETDDTWRVSESAVRFSEIYDGEIFDARIEDFILEETEEFSFEIDLVPQQGGEIIEAERIEPAEIITTPKNELVFDFAQNMTGYIEFSLPETTREGEEIIFSFAEVLCAEGNFYTENYRSAKSELRYICKNGEQEYKPKFTFFGFRYVRVRGVKPKKITAIVVQSEMKRTGWLSCSNALLNRFFENVIWGQKGNFLDVPTDCPQRDERLGWTGDAQVFIKTAALNFDVEKFFTKWLADLKISQLENGLVPHVVPDAQQGRGGSAAWGDAAVICPWEIYLAYGNKEILENQFDSMCKWVDFITATTTTENLWTGGTHFGDWLSLELPPPAAPDIRRGATPHDFIASAFYAHSTGIVIKAGEVLNRDVSSYKMLREKIVTAFKKTFPPQNTQTEYVLALHFDLTDDPQETAAAFAKKIAADGCLKTGFVGTPYILHVLSRFGYTGLAYDLLLREEYPSWLYPVTKGATTVWERWDSIKPDGSFQSAEMNSFNHYAYGAVKDWVYTVAAGIQTVEECPGYEKIKIAPHPDPGLEFLSARIETRRGTVFSKWQYVNGKIKYEIDTPSPAEIIIDGLSYNVEKGAYIFFGKGYGIAKSPL